MKSPEALREELGLDPAKKTAVLFSHILWDANLFFGEDVFEDFGQWLVESARAACANRGVNWIIKLHPGNVWKRVQEDLRTELDEVSLIRSRIGSLPPHVRLLFPDTDINTFSLFSVVDYAITVRGTIGIELSCFGIPVFTAGTGRYSGLGFTIDSKTREEYLDRLRCIEGYPRLSPEQTELAKRYAYTLFVRRPWRYRTMKTHYMPIECGNHPLAWNLEIRAESLRDLEQASDLCSFADWAEDRGALDYLASPESVESPTGSAGDLHP
jgi:hypothetical protein